MRYARPAVVVGAAAGLLTAGGSILYPSLLYPVNCSLDICISTPTWTSSLLGALGILLAFDSAVGFVGPRMVFYGETFVSALIALSLILVDGARGVGSPLFLAVLVLSAAAAALSFLAARTKTGLTEQSNPMNLPVFG